MEQDESRKYRFWISLNLTLDQRIYHLWYDQLGFKFFYC